MSNTYYYTLSALIHWLEWSEMYYQCRISRRSETATASSFNNDKIVMELWNRHKTATSLKYEPIGIVLIIKSRSALSRIQNKLYRARQLANMTRWNCPQSNKEKHGTLKVWVMIGQYRGIWSWSTPCCTIIFRICHPTRMNGDSNCSVTPRKLYGERMIHLKSFVDSFAEATFSSFINWPKSP